MVKYVWCSQIHSLYGGYIVELPALLYRVIRRSYVNLTGSASCSSVSMPVSLDILCSGYPSGHWTTLGTAAFPHAGPLLSMLEPCCSSREAPRPRGQHLHTAGPSEGTKRTPDSQLARQAGPLALTYPGDPRSLSTALAWAVSRCKCISEAWLPPATATVAPLRLLIT